MSSSTRPQASRNGTGIVVKCTFKLKNRSPRSPSTANAPSSETTVSLSGSGRRQDKRRLEWVKRHNFLHHKIAFWKQSVSRMKNDLPELEGEIAAELRLFALAIDVRRRNVHTMALKSSPMAWVFERLDAIRTPLLGKWLEKRKRELEIKRLDARKDLLRGEYTLEALNMELMKFNKALKKARKQGAVIRVSTRH